MSTAEISLACAWALVDELVRGGVHHACLSPGSRSTPLTLALARHPEMAISVEPPGPRAGYVLVGANQLVGVYDPERYRWLRENFAPIGHVAYSHLLFHVPPDRLQEDHALR